MSFERTSRAAVMASIVRTVAASAAVSIAFTVVLSVVARATRDGAGAVRDYGVELAGLDASEGRAAAVDATDQTPSSETRHIGADAVELATSEHGAQGGAPPAAGPPIVFDDLRSILTPIIEGCLAEALRFDPSLGGTVEIAVSVRRGALDARARATAPSPVFARCIERNARSLPVAYAPVEPVHIAARVALDGLRGRVNLEEVSRPGAEGEPGP